jgi:type II secretory pathway component GspD/PulD (secretin)
MNGRLLASLLPPLLAAALALPPVATALGEGVSLDVKDADVFDVLRLLAVDCGIDLVADATLKHERVSLHLTGVTCLQALNVMTQAYALRVRREGRAFVVGSATSSDLHANDASPQTPGRAVTLLLRYARSFEAAKQLKGIIPDNAYVADDKQNAVIVTGGPSTEATARALLSAIDVPTPQVMFEVRVADIALDAERDMGVLYGSGGVGTTTYLFQNKTIPLTATLNALVSDGRAQLLATPRLATLNNREASLLIGENYPITTQTVTGGAATTSVQFVDIGVKLRVTPTIGSDGSITAELHPEFSALAGTNAQGFPIITNRKIDATLRVNRDETIVLGGLLSDDETLTTTKVPFLGDLPILGEVFRNRQRSHRKDDVVFLITPHVL